MASILYTPEIDRGEQIQGDEIIKYDVHFKKGQTSEVHDALSLKFLNCPYFSLAKKGAVIKELSDEPLSTDVAKTPKPKKKTTKKKK